MTLDLNPWSTLIIIILSTAFYYLGSRAIITRALWSRYPPKLAAFMDCAACAGYWYGLGVALWCTHDIVLSTTTGLITLVTTPIAGGYMQRGFDALGTIQVDSDADV